MSLFLPLPTILRDAYRGRPGVTVEVTPDAESTGRHGWGVTPDAVVFHHVGYGREPGTVSLDAAVKWIRDSSPIAPLANIVSGIEDGIVRVVITACGYTNHAGIGSWPGVLGNRDVGWEAMHSGLAREPWDPAHLDEIAVGHAAILRHLDEQDYR